MKKILTMVAAVLLICCLTTAALAETPLRLIYDAGYKLLFETQNVTLKGHAEFSLDGRLFKTADATCIQDGDRSSLEWNLLTPRRDGSVREGGYTVIANGEWVYVMETFYPGVYKTGTTAPTYTILRKSVQLSWLTDLLRLAADQPDMLLGKNAVTVLPGDTAALEIAVHLGDDASELVNVLLKLASQFIAKRYFNTDFDQLSIENMVPMDNYITTTGAILGATCGMKLENADILLKRDEGGQFESMSGDLTILLNTAYDGERALGISFRVNAADLGSSHVDLFDPAAYGVTLAEGAMDPAELDGEDGEMPETEEPMDSNSAEPETEASAAGETGEAETEEPAAGDSAAPEESTPFPPASLYHPVWDAADAREDGRPPVWEMDFAPAEYWEQLGKSLDSLGVNTENLMEKQGEWYAEYGSSEFWPQEMKMCAFMLTVSRKMVEDDENFAFPMLPTAGKKTSEEIEEIAWKALHAEADETLGKEWADQLRYTACLWSRGYLLDKGVYTEEPAWTVEFRTYDEEYQDWATRYYMEINEDGEILFSELTLDSHG